MSCGKECPKNSSLPAGPAAKLSATSRWEFQVLGGLCVRGSALAIAYCITSALAAEAYFVERTYEDFASDITSGIQHVKAAKELSDREAFLAEAMAATWVHIGPCNENPAAGEEHAETKRRVVSAVLRANPNRTFDAAVLEMISVITRSSGGRPSENLCRFALERALWAPRAE